MLCEIYCHRAHVGQRDAVLVARAILPVVVREQQPEVRNCAQDVPLEVENKVICQIV